MERARVVVGSDDSPALAGLTRILRARESAREHCPLCRELFPPEAALVRCELCSTPYHWICVDEMGRGGCTTLACSGMLAPELGTSATPAAPDPVVVARARFAAQRESGPACALCRDRLLPAEGHVRCGECASGYHWDCMPDVSSDACPGEGCGGEVSPAIGVDFDAEVAKERAHARFAARQGGLQIQVSPRAGTGAGGAASFADFALLPEEPAEAWTPRRSPAGSNEPAELPLKQVLLAALGIWSVVVVTIWGVVPYSGSAIALTLSWSLFCGVALLLRTLPPGD